MKLFTKLSREAVPVSVWVDRNVQQYSVCQEWFYIMFGQREAKRYGEIISSEKCSANEGTKLCQTR